MSSTTEEVEAARKRLADAVRDYRHCAVRVEADDVHTLVAAAKEIEELRRGWQPIETAPKDGTELIGRLSPTRFSLIYYFAPSAITNGWRNEMGSAVKPTHWMPLPPLKESK